MITPKSGTFSLTMVYGSEMLLHINYSVTPMLEFLSSKVVFIFSYEWHLKLFTFTFLIKTSFVSFILLCVEDYATLVSKQHLLVEIFCPFLHLLNPYSFTYLLTRKDNCCYKNV